MKYSFHGLIHFLPLFYSCQFRRFDSIQFLCYHDQILAGWRFETLLDSTQLNFARTTQKTQPLYCRESVFTAPFPNNGSYSIISCVFFAAGIFLPSRFLAMNIYSDFIIPAFGRHVTLYFITHTLIQLYKRQTALLINLSILLYRISNFSGDYIVTCIMILSDGSVEM
jgi:hypothetical protein